MADSIVNVKLVEANGLLSKIQINGVTYELKDLIARQNIDTLRTALTTLEGKHDSEIKTINDTIKNIQENAYDDTELQKLIAALQNGKADKTQVATDIESAVAAEAEIARAAEKANADEITRIDNALKAAIENEGAGLDSIKELATWIEEHGPEAENMSKAISKNAEDIAALDKAYKAADEAIDGRLDVIEAVLGDGENSVADQIADAKGEAIEAAKDYTDEEIGKLGDLAKKNEAELGLGALAKKNSAEGTVAGQTISGVKATGTSTGSINVALTAGSETINSTGSYTPAGSVTGGKVTAAGSVAIVVTNADAQATLGTADYQPAGDVSVVPTTAEIQVVKSKGTAASFVEGEFTAATLDKEDVTANYATEGLVGKVEDECLTFSAAAIDAITATKVNNFTGGSKAADSWTANVPAEIETKTVATGIASSSFTGTVAEGLKVTSVTYQKHDGASATFTGSEVDVTGATFSGDAATIEVAGNGKTYAIDADNTKFNGAAIELNVGDIVVTEKTVTVQ